MIARAATLALLSATPAMAADPASPAVCRAIADPGARLACYDAAFERSPQPVADREPPADARAARASDRAARGGERDRFIDSTVASAVPRGGDQWTVRLADGTGWRTTQPGLGRAPAVGALARIRPGLVGGATLQIGRGPKVHVMPVGEAGR